MLEGFINVSAISGSGIYALIRNGVVVYIGQSKSMLARIAAHKANWGRNSGKGKSLPAWWPKSLAGILFDEVWVLPCRVENLNEVERAMIELYKPRYNIRVKTPDPVAIASLFAGPQPKFERRI